MRTDIKNFIALIIVARVKLTDQRLFDLRSPLNVCRHCEIILARKFNVVDAQSLISCVVMETTMDQIK